MEFGSSCFNGRGGIRAGARRRSIYAYSFFFSLKIFRILEPENNRNLDPHRRIRLYQNQNGDEEEEEEEEPENVSLRNPSTASFQELFDQNQLLYARRLGQPRSYFPPLEPESVDHATLRDKMRQSYEDPPSSSRLGRGSSSAAAGGGEIVEVQGGHIVRATGKKDRHSKVCTAKGPRDRRVRLAAHTAIQFYDVQDRLGYDRPSKAVDWLIKKAKAAIDELAELPAWHPTASAPENAQKKREDEEQKNMRHAVLGAQNEQMSSFLPPSLDSDAIADTIKSFFPTGSAGESSSSAMEFHNFSTTHNNSQDLRLSLQSFQDPILLHHHHYPPPPPPTNPSHPHHSEQARAGQGQQQPVLLSGIPLGFDGWPPPPPWNSGGDPTGGSFQFNSPQLMGSGQFFSSQQRGPLQSSNTPSLRAWMDPSPAITISMADHSHHHHHLPVYPSSAFASGYGGYSGFHIPARIQGEEEEHDGYSDKPSSASSDSRH